MSSILIVEDDIDIGNLLEEALTNEGYVITRAYSGTEAKLLSQNKYNLILLDLMLPGLAGEELLDIFKGNKIIVISAKADLDNKVNLLLNGASDYITKPFYLKEVLARIKVALRNDNNMTDILRYKELTLNNLNHKFYVNDIEVKLTKTEFAIIKVLLEKPDFVYSKQVLLEKIEDLTPDGSEQSLNAHISNLRTKINKYAKNNYIEAIWGIGYKLEK